MSMADMIDERLVSFGLDVTRRCNPKNLQNDV